MHRWWWCILEGVVAEVEIGMRMAIRVESRKLYRGEEWLEGKGKTTMWGVGDVGRWVVWGNRCRVGGEAEEVGWGAVWWWGGGDIGWRDMGGGGGGSTKEYIGKRANRRP